MQPRKQVGGHPDLNEMARRVIDANHYMTLATIDLNGRPRLSPVYYTPARYSDLYWSPRPRPSIHATSRPGRRGRLTAQGTHGER